MFNRPHAPDVHCQRYRLLVETRPCVYYRLMSCPHCKHCRALATENADPHTCQALRAALAEHPTSADLVALARSDAALASDLEALRFGWRRRGPLTVRGLGYVLRALPWVASEPGPGHVTRWSLTPEDPT